MNVKYIYFEIHYLSNSKVKDFEAELKNENIILLKPETNSNGHWGHTFISKTGKIVEGEETKKVVEQYWVDIVKYAPNFRKNSIVHKNFKLAIEEIRKKMYEQKQMIVTFQPYSE